MFKVHVFSLQKIILWKQDALSIGMRYMVWAAEREEAFGWVFSDSWESRRFTLRGRGKLLADAFSREV